MSNPRHLVHAQRLAQDGHGISYEKDGTLEFWVPNLLPGESAWVEIMHRSQHQARAWAAIAERDGEPSPSRTRPLCPAHGICGGCAWQHLDADGQLEQKRLLVETAFKSALTNPPPVPTPLASKPARYRNKGKYVVARVGDEIVLGAYKPRTHQVVSTLGCQIVEAAIDTVAVRVAACATQLCVPVFDESKSESTGLRYVILRSNREGEVLALLVCTSDTPAEGMAALANELDAHDAVAGVLRCDNDLRSGALLTEHITSLCGAPTMAERICGATVPLGPSAFWQLNRDQAEQAYADLATSLALPAGARVVELYCGVGAISFALARAGYNVLGIESDAAAVAIATQVAAESGLDAQLQFACGDATVVDATTLAGADAIVVDPPRKGLGQRGRQQLIDAHPATIAYLSCGPQSLAEDLAALVEAGYRIETLRLYDFMPGTAQVESLVLLRRG